MRARGKESVKVASFARSSMTVSAVSASESVCIGSPRARRPLVVWLRFAASRLHCRTETGGDCLYCPLRPRRQSGASSDFGFLIIPYHIPTLLITSSRNVYSIVPDRRLVSA